MTYPDEEQRIEPGMPVPNVEYPFEDVSEQYTSLMLGPTADDDGDLD